MNNLIINSVCGIGSTGKICADIANEYSEQGHNVVIAFGRDGYVPESCKKYAYRIGTDLDVKFHVLYTRLFDAHGFGSKRATRQFLGWADEFSQSSTCHSTQKDCLKPCRTEKIVGALIWSSLGT